MPPRGRHRRPQPPTRLSQMSVAVTASGATIALPLLGAASAYAAPANSRDRVANCESGGYWESRTGNGHFGGLQSARGTWRAHGGTAFAPRADPSAGQRQTTVTEWALATRRPNTWAGCVHQAGPGDDGSARQVGRTVPRKELRPQAAQRADRGSRPGTASSYRVASGDTLSGIADEHAVRGGWQRLYSANHQVVGNDPDLIRPGQRLTLPGDGRTAGHRASEQRSPGHRKAPTAAASKADPPRQPAPRAAAPSPDESAYTAPVSGSLGTPYGAGGSLWSSGHHTGQDFPVPVGTSVRSVAAGTVVQAGWSGAYGYQVVVRHEDSHFTQYAHLSSLLVRTGQQVGTGHQLGRSGATGNATGPHLHFEVRTGPDYGSDIDPLAYLRSHGVRL